MARSILCWLGAHAWRHNATVHHADDSYTHYESCPNCGKRRTITFPQIRRRAHGEGTR